MLFTIHTYALIGNTYNNFISHRKDYNNKEKQSGKLWHKKIRSKTNTFTYVLTKYNRKQKEYTDRGIDKENESANVP